MKNQFSLLIIPVILLFSSACSTIEIFKENTEFRPYKEYQSFVILNKEIGRKGFGDELIDAIVSDGLQNSFENLGLIYDKNDPELVISYTSNEDLRQKEVYNNPYPMWGGRIWDPFMFDPRFMPQQNPISTKNYQLMQLIVDFTDTKNLKMLMRLTAVSEVSDQKQKKKKVIQSVEQIAQTYQFHLEDLKNTKNASR
jgi:hypothetical protein